MLRPALINERAQSTCAHGTFARWTHLSPGATLPRDYMNFRDLSQHDTDYNLTNHPLNTLERTAVLRDTSSACGCAARNTSTWEIGQGLVLPYPPGPK